MRVTLVLLVAIATTAQPSYAIGPYRCSGRVQYHPCTMEFATGKPYSTSSKHKNTVRTKPSAPPSSTPYVEIMTTSFLQVSAQRGIWRGRLRGNGVIQPELQIFRGVQLESSRAMGSVVLIEQETPFTFNSALPSGKGWTWRIVAQAH